MEKLHANISYEQSRCENNYRNQIEILQRRVCLLTGKDKILMTMYLENGNTFRQMASLIGINEANIARRINKITKRLINGKYIICVRNSEQFSKIELGIAKNYFLLGMSIRDIAKKFSITYYRSRQTLQKIQNLIELIEAEGKSNRHRSKAS